MRIIKSLADVQVVLKELGQWKDALLSKDWDRRGLKIKNAGAAVDPNDYVILSQLPQNTQTNNVVDQFYSIVFNSIGAVSDGMESASYISPHQRIGLPIRVILGCEEAPSGGDLVMNMTVGGVNILTTPIRILSGQFGPVESGNFINPVKKIGDLTKIKPVVVTANGAAFVTISLVVHQEI